jgi:hypothetical protein
MFVSAAAAEDLPGFSKFVLRFLIQMSRVRKRILFVVQCMEFLKEYIYLLG